MRIAFFTPLSPLKTAIADHSEGLLPHLAKLADVDLYIDDNYRPDNPEIIKHFTIRNFHEFPSRAEQYDAMLYAVGDHAGFHGYMYPLLQQFPGVVILHDTTLHRAMIHMAFMASKPELYLQELQYAYGLTNSSIAHRVLSGFGEALVKHYPLFERVVDHSLGVIVHNEHARRQVLHYCPKAQVTQINQHFFLPPGFADRPVDMNALRTQWGLEGRFVIGSCGILVPEKRIDNCLRAFTRFLDHHPDAVYFFVGNYPSNYDLPGIIHNYGLDDHVRITGWMDPIAFTQHMLELQQIKYRLVEVFRIDVECELNFYRSFKSFFGDIENMFYRSGQWHRLILQNVREINDSWPTAFYPDFKALVKVVPGGGNFFQGSVGFGN